MKINGKHLDARGKGEIIYDYANDILTARAKDRDYLKSIDMENASIDIDREGFMTGLRIFDASKLFGIPKITLKQIKHFQLDARTEANIIRIDLKFVCVQRNKQLIRQGQSFEVHNELNIQAKQAVTSSA